MNLKTATVLFVLAATFANVAARDLKAELTAMAPVGKTIRLCYVKGGAPQNFNQAVGAAVYAVSSEDGVIRKIYPAGAAIGDYDCVNMTDDGTRVIFYDRGRGEVVVVNFNGTLVRTFAADRLADYWINPQDKTEWAVITTGSAIQRININSPGAPVAVTTKAMPQDIYIDAGLCTGISDDGKKLVVVFESSTTTSIGLLTISTNAYTPGVAGCWPQMRSGTPIQFSQNAGIYRHRGPYVENEDGTKDVWIPTSDTMENFFAKNPTLDASNSNPDCYPEVQHSSDGHRWLRDRNYLTFTCQRSKVNPILWRVSDSKWTYIEDGDSCIFAGDMEGVVGSFSPSGAVEQTRSHFGFIQQTKAPRTYSLAGRLIAQPAKRDRSQTGIVISQSPRGIVTRLSH